MSSATPALALGMTLRTLPALLLAALMLPAAAHAACPEGTTCTDAYFPSGDGTMLHADVILPKGTEDQRHPVILSIGPYFNHGGQQGLIDYDPVAEGPNERFKDLYTEGRIFQKGYALVLVDLRGFGASAGCNDFGGPGERADSKAAVEWAAAQPWSTGKVGMWGKSYDGWTQVMALDGKPKGLAAAVIQSPIIDGYRTLYQDGVHYDAGWYGTPALYQQIDAGPPPLTSSPDYLLGVVQGTDPLCYARNIVEQNTTLDHDTPFWKARDLPAARGSDVPVLWSHGFLDANTKPDNFLPVWSRLTGPHRAWFGQYTHVRPQDKAPNGRDSITGRNGFIDEAMRWLDRYVKGTDAPVEQDPVVEVEDGATMKYRAEAAWPPADAAPFELTTRPGQVRTMLGTSAESAPPDGVWSVTRPLPHDVHLAGAPTLTVEAAAPARANVHAILYDVDAQNRAKLVTRGARAIGSAGRATIQLYPQDWTFPRGHRLALVLAPSDDDWYLAPNQGATIAYGAGKLALPFLRYVRDSFLPSKPSEDEKARPPRFDASSVITTENETAFQLPPALTTPPAAPLPGASAAPRRITVRLARRNGRFVASGTAPAGQRLTVRLRRGSRTVQTRRVTTRPSGRFTVRFRRVRRAGAYRALVTTRDAGATVRVRSRVLRLR